jgi:hypothetical protein
MPYSKNIMIIESPSREGFVSVDFDSRCFRSGICMSGPFMRHGAYSGKGWRQTLVDDAIEYLREAVGL